MSGEREAKRARLACLNCRRKKTRCHGERPACALCVRLGQHCDYPAATAEQAPANSNDDLATRVEKLEAHIRAAEGVTIDGIGNDRYGGSDKLRGMWPPSSSSDKSYTPQQMPDEVQHHMPQWSGPRLDAEATKFSRLPPVSVLTSLVDTYFANCHNQPYCYFHESSLRRRLAANELPQYLLLAFAATASRYSTHEYFGDRQLQAVEAFSRAAWVIIIDQVFATDRGVEVAAAQACGMLAVVDFTAGHHHLGWVKIGLAIRLVQGLKLNAEPDVALPTWQKEEHRRIFWSLYVLDKFVSCGRSRPPAILDVDCTLALPCSEEAFRMGTLEDTMTLSAFQGLPSDVTIIKGLDHFAILVVMCATLDLTVRETFQRNSTTPPSWDCRSNFAKIGSIIMSCESMHAAGANQLSLYLGDKFGTYDGFDRQRAGHFIWARGVYHLCGCMLYHPVNLHRHRQTHGRDFPSTFAREALDRCQVHAAQLTDILQTLQTTGCCARGSFLGYLAACAASVHQLYIHSPNQETATQAAVASGTCFAFLEHQPIFWPNYSFMASALRDCDIDARLARILIDPSELVLGSEADSLQLDALGHIIDYGWLSDAGRMSSAIVPPFPSDIGADLGDWIFFDSQIGEHRGLQ